MNLKKNCFKLTQNLITENPLGRYTYAQYSNLAGSDYWSIKCICVPGVAEISEKLRGWFAYKKTKKRARINQLNWSYRSDR